MKKSLGKKKIGPRQTGGPANAKTLQAVLGAANQFFAAGNYEPAERNYRHVLSVAPNNVNALYNLAIIAHRTNRIGEGVRLLQRVIAADKGFAGAYNSLGILYEASNDFAAAEASYLKCLGIQPGNPEAHYNLGCIYFRKEEFGPACQCFRSALKYRPDFLQAIINLGIVLHKLGDFEGALSCLEKARSMAPDFALIHNNLGNVLRDKKDLDGAEEALQRAVSLQPDYGEAYYNLGMAYRDKGRLDEAEQCFSRAVNLSPDFAEAYNGLGLLQDARGKWEESLELFRRAVSLNPRCYEALCNIGRYYQQQGEFDSALEYFDKALLISPEYTPAHFSVASIKRYSPGDEHIARMENMLLREHIGPDRKAELSFALAKAYEDLGEYEKSFSFLSAGNALKRSSIEYSPDETKRFFEKIKSIFSGLSALPARRTETSRPAPIFILGMPRSGTTLVEQIVASHSRVFGAGEIDCFEHALHTLTHTGTVEAAVDALAVAGLDDIHRAGTCYLEEVAGLSGGQDYITDKMPHNFLLIGFIYFALPDAKIIHCRRDPMDNCLSLYKQRLSGVHRYAYDLRELGGYYLCYRDLMDFWRALFPGFIYDISYEKVVDDLAGETKKLLQWIGLEWDENCLTYYKTPGMVTTASNVQVRKPIYNKSVRLWKRYEKQLQPLLECFDIKP